MKIRVVALVLGIAILAAPTFAADVDGAWSGNIDTPNGAVQMSFTFASASAVLTGSTTSPDGSKVDIKNGKIDGDKISFDVDLSFGGMTFTLSYKGVVSADQIKMTADFMGMPFEFVVKKAS